MDTLFWWTGAVVWSVLALVVGWLLLEVLWGGVVTASYFRASLKSAKARKVVVPWWKVTSEFFRKWPEFIFYRNNGGTTISWTGGVWHGVGDWTLYPVALPAADASATDSPPGA